MNIFIVLYILFYSMLARHRLAWAIFVLIFALPSYLIRFSIFGVPFTLLELMILIVFATWFTQNRHEQIKKIKYIFNKPKSLKKINYPYDKEIILLLVIAFISAGVAGFGTSAFGVLKAYFIEPILLFLVIFNVFAKQKESQNLNLLIYPLALSAFFVSCFAIFQKITAIGLPVEWVNSGRVTSFFEYPNAIGLYLGPIVLILVGYFLSKISTLKLKTLNLKSQLPSFFLFLTIILSLLSIYFAKSEGALVGIAAGLVLFGILANKKIRLITIGLIIVGTIGIFTNQQTRSFAIEKITLKDLSGEIRKQQWRETWSMLKESNQQFILGSGLSNYQNKIRPYHQEGIFFNKNHDPDFRRKIVIFDEKYKSEHWQPVEIYLYPHNIFLNFWTELGLLGMILFAWIIGKFSIQNHTAQNMQKRFIALGLLGAMAVIFVHGLVDVPYFKNDLAILFWLIITMSGIIKIQNLEIKN